jgi:FAD/FMN-containing dehydrogenase
LDFSPLGIARVPLTPARLRKREFAAKLSAKPDFRVFDADQLEGPSVNRRKLIRTAIGLPLLAGGLVHGLAFAESNTGNARDLRSRVRPGDRDWPSPAKWETLKQAVGGRLLKPRSPFTACQSAPEGDACREALRQIKNPFYIGDEVALTQTSGWLNAWNSHPSSYAVVANSTADVVAAVKFARTHNLRLVIKGGGHSYQGTSQAPDSLLVWMRHMNAIQVHDAFVGQGCVGRQAPQTAVTIEAGAMWIDAYDAVTTNAGRYVQGGGCTTVGVAGLVQSGGFSSFSKNYGTAAAGLIEAEIVTADGQVRIANACQQPDLFWAIKGGGGGSLGVITRLTLRTRELPTTFGAVFGIIKASSDVAYRELIARAVNFYQSALFNRHWGEQIILSPLNSLQLHMVFQGLTQQEAERTWAPFLDWIRANSSYSFPSEVKIVSLPARHFWDADFMKKNAPGSTVADTRSGSSERHFLWSGDQDETGHFMYGYQSLWLPDTLLENHRQEDLADALFASSRQWQISLHTNKGLAGAPLEEIAAAKDTATNPDVLNAFALVICAGGGPPAYTGLPGSGPNAAMAQFASARIDQAMNELRRVAPDAGAYVSESNYFQPSWQKAFWGSNYPKLAEIKKRYDPDGLFYMWHGVGSEQWSADGFRQL